jgi:nitrate/TMAO reductase-like tetraheme cytochrome c subunit
MQGQMNKSDILSANLQGSHPFSFNSIPDSSDLAPSLVQGKQTADPQRKVLLVRGNVECESCHNPHVQNIDKVSLTFLVRDSSSGQMCLACHATAPRTVNNLPNPLVSWPTSIHATVSNSTLPAANVGAYATVAQNSCSSCHLEHNANGAARLLRGPVPALAAMDAATQNCITCHNGNNNISPALPNVYAEFSKIAHPFPSGVNTHDAAEATLLNNNRHATCVDCHNPHSVQKVGSAFNAPPQIRVSQGVVKGILASDGISISSPAQNQHENCLRCHGTSSGKGKLATQSTYGYRPALSVSAPDPLNIIPQFASTATSSHPVSHDRSSVLAQPSLLANMLQLDGSTQGRTMGVRIFCTDCHNSDDNREFGGPGPNGPHGSIYPHILERRYEMSQVTPGVYPVGGPGSHIQNPFPGQQTSAGGAAPGPWALCGKCHNLTNVLANSSFRYHSTHVSTVGASCSVCHTAHGMGTTAPTITGERMVNFDIKVVAPNNLGPSGPVGISYNRATNTCVLVCHTASHNYDGTVTQVGANQQAARGIRVRH